MNNRITTVHSAKSGMSLHMESDMEQELTLDFEVLKNELAEGEPPP